jgi:ubiquinone/menaquinone biosynthesis C-methylase UbiE
MCHTLRRMQRYASDVLRLVPEGRVILWSGRTGRHVSLSAEVAAAVEQWTPGLLPPPGLAAVGRRLDALGMLQESSPPPLEVLCPARSRRVLLLPKIPALWAPLPGVRTPGGFAYAERPLTKTQLALWRACNGSRTVAAVAQRAGCTIEEARDFFVTLTHPDVQALQLRLRPVRGRDPSLLHLVSGPRPANRRSDHQHGPAGETTLAHWHVHEITDGERHFDDRETTVAHALALGHPALRGEPYGARLHRALDERGLLPDDGLTLEIGPGDGELGAAWLARAAERGRPQGEYVRLDISPVLLETQRQRQPGTRELLGSATDIPLPDRSVHLIVCNEVLADLTAAPYDAELGEGDAAVGAALARYGLAALPGRALYNRGAWEAIAEAARVLAPGGAAVFTEFGADDEVPTETTHLDHPEVSIRFGHLRRVAETHGLSVQLVELAELLDADLTARWLSRHSYEALRARARAAGRHLAARAWTPETLPLPEPVEGLEWVPITDHGPGPLITRFQALLLRRQ